MKYRASVESVLLLKEKARTKEHVFTIISNGLNQRTKIKVLKPLMGVELKNELFKEQIICKVYFAIRS